MLYLFYIFSMSLHLLQMNNEQQIKIVKLIKDKRNKKTSQHDCAGSENLETVKPYHAKSK